MLVCSHEQHHSASLMPLPSCIPGAFGGSELEAAIRSKQDLLKELEAEDSTASPRREAELHIEDLKETIRAVSKSTSSPAALGLDSPRHLELGLCPRLEVCCWAAHFFAQ